MDHRLQDAFNSGHAPFYESRLVLSSFYTARALSSMYACMHAQWENPVMLTLHPHGQGHGC